MVANGMDWSVPEQQLARKIVALAGSAPISLTVENRSSLGRRDSEIIQNGLRTALESMGVRLASDDPAAAVVTISLSENLTSYVWVAEVRHGSNEAAIAIISAPRPAGATSGHDSVPLSLRKIYLWSQADRILDLAVLEENATPTRIAVLDPETVSIHRLQGGSWQREQALEIAHKKPWPRDLRGRIIPSRDGLDVYLPGVVCHSAAGGYAALNCHDGDDPWPLIAPAINAGFSGVGSANNLSAAIPTQGFFAPARNFFTGDLTSAGGKLTTVPKFYSAALLPSDRTPLWIFAAVDGQVHVFDGATNRTVRLNWGSDLTSLRTSCGAGWQVLAIVPTDASDSARAYEVPDRDPVPVSAPVDFPGTISALWTEARGDSAVAVVKNQETGNYEAFRLAVACSQ